MKSKTLFTLVLVPFMVGCGSTVSSSTSPSSESSQPISSTEPNESSTTSPSSESSQPTSSDEPKIITVLDGQGRNVEMVEGKTNRVVCIGAGALRYYSYIGDISKLVGVEEIDSGTTFGVGQALRPYYMAGYDTFKTLPVIGKGGPMAQVADAEKIAAVKPDVVVSFLSADANNELQNTIKVPVIGLKQGGDGVFDTATINSFLALGLVFNRQSRAESLISYIEDCKDDFDSLTLTTETYYAGGIGNWGQTSMYGSFLGFPVFKYAKVKSAIDDMEFKDKDGKVISKGQVTLDMEKLQAANPDHILMDTAGINGFIADYKKEGNKAKYDALNAFQTDETYQLMPYNAYYSNLEVQLMSTYYVASIAHEEFTVNLDEKMNEITTKFLGKEMYNEIKAHQYGMGGYKQVDLKELAK